LAFGHRPPPHSSGSGKALFRPFKFFSWVSGHLKKHRPVPSRSAWAFFLASLALTRTPYESPFPLGRQCGPPLGGVVGKRPPFTCCPFFSERGLTPRLPPFHAFAHLKLSSLLLLFALHGWFQTTRSTLFSSLPPPGARNDNPSHIPMKPCLLEESWREVFARPSHPFPP